jgi:hypothetical protein
MGWVTILGEDSPKGRLFALAVLKRDKNSQPFWANFFQSIEYLLTLTKTWVWLHFGRFFHICEPQRALVLG